MRRKTEELQVLACKKGLSDMRDSPFVLCELSGGATYAASYGADKERQRTWVMGTFSYASPRLFASLSGKFPRQESCPIAHSKSYAKTHTTHLEWVTHCQEYANRGFFGREREREGWTTAVHYYCLVYLRRQDRFEDHTTFVLSSPPASKGC